MGRVDSAARYEHPEGAEGRRLTTAQAPSAMRGGYTKDVSKNGEMTMKQCVLDN